MTLLEKIKKHVPGKGCKCEAYNSHECGCRKIDWRSKREVFADAVIKYSSHDASTYWKKEENHPITWREIDEAAKWLKEQGYGN